MLLIREGKEREVLSRGALIEDRGDGCVFVQIRGLCGFHVNHLRPASIVGRSSDGNTAVAPAVEIGRPVREDFQFRECEADFVVY